MSKTGSWLNMKPWDTGFYISFKEGIMRVDQHPFHSFSGKSIMGFLWGAISFSLSPHMSWFPMLLFPLHPSTRSRHKSGQ